MNDVKVKIDLAKPMGYIGLGIPLILAKIATKPTDVTEEENTIEEEITTEGEISNDEKAAAPEVEVRGYTDGVTFDDIKELYDKSSDVYKAAELIFMQDNKPKQIAICETTTSVVKWLETKGNLSHNWRQLICVGASDEIAEISAAIEKTDDKMYFASVPVDDTTVFNRENVKRTVILYCTDEKYPNPEAALVGATAGLKAGAFTYHDTILKGIVPQNLSDDEIAKIHKKGGITFVTKAGDNVTSEGITLGGEYIDIIDSEDYVIQQIAYRVQKQLNSSQKIPYTNNGIAILESVVIDVLQGAFNNGVIATTYDGSPAFTVDFALREDTTEEQRSTRTYIGGQFTFALAGAVHYVEITGEITL